jgi:hypothetical protein
MAKAVADVNNPDEKQGGFASDNSDITGFSHMHDSGTGGVWNRCSSKILAHIHTVSLAGQLSNISANRVPRRYHRQLLLH